MSRQLPPLPFFHTKEEISDNFHNSQFWCVFGLSPLIHRLPFVEEVCWREGIEVKKVEDVPAGDEGTNPVFIINREVVVKLYSHISEDDNSDEVFQREVVSGKVLASASSDIAPLIPVLRFSGTLVDVRKVSSPPNIGSKGPTDMAFCIIQFLTSCLELL